MSRWRAESIYLGRYIGSGTFNTLMGFAVIFAVMWAGFSPVIANIAGYGVGFVLGFVLSRKIVFRSNGSFVRESVRYLIAFLLAFILNLFVLHVVIKNLGFPAAVAQVAGAVVYTIAMYTLTRFYAFSPSPVSKGSID